MLTSFDQNSVTCCSVEPTVNIDHVHVTPPLHAGRHVFSLSVHACVCVEKLLAQYLVNCVGKFN